MTEDLTYKEIKTAKTGEAVPVFTSGSAMYSLYNPLRDAEAFADSFRADGQESAQCGFAVVFGIGNGLHITALAKNNPALRVLAVEHSARNIDFLKERLPRAAIFKHPRVTLCSLDELPESFLSSYVPALHGAARVLFQQAWKNAHPRDCETGSGIIAHASECIKSDYATQAHFGKIWHRNIFLNIAALNAAAKADCRREKIQLPVNKEACVIAAGPSLDKSADILAHNRSEKFIIAADTAYPALLSRGIFPDAVVTIDGQAASARHFLSARTFRADKRVAHNTILFADLCCNPVVPRLFFSRGSPVIFVKNRHPLSELARRYALHRGAPKDFLPLAQSGAGTVTVSAASLAFRSGFSKVSFFGADFSFTGGKPYTRGTYLDGFFASSFRASPGETAFTSLMYRSALCFADGGGKIPTTPLLLSYKKSLESLKNLPRESVPLCFDPPPGGIFDGFAGWYTGQLFVSLFNRTEFDPLSSRDGILFSCLPLLAAQKTSEVSRTFCGRSGEQSKKDEIFCAMKLAYEAAKRYTIT